MASPSLKAQFFVTPEGVVFPRADALPRREALRIYQRDGGVCQRCGDRVRFGGNHVAPFDVVKSGAIDHIFPRSRGGQNGDENLRLLCKSCNSQKAAS